MVVVATGADGFAPVPPAPGLTAPTVLGRLGSATEMVVVVGVGVATVITPVVPTGVLAVGTFVDGAVCASASPCVTHVTPSITTPAHVRRGPLGLRLPTGEPPDRMHLRGATNVPNCASLCPSAPSSIRN